MVVPVLVEATNVFRDVTFEVAFGEKVVIELSCPRPRLTGFEAGDNEDDCLAWRDGCRNQTAVVVAVVAHGYTIRGWRIGIKGWRIAEYDAVVATVAKAGVELDYQLYGVISGIRQGNRVVAIVGVVLNKGIARVVRTAKDRIAEKLVVTQRAVNRRRRWTVTISHCVVGRTHRQREQDKQRKRALAKGRHGVSPQRIGRVRAIERFTCSVRNSPEKTASKDELVGLLSLVIPAKAGIHLDVGMKSKMDSGFRRNDDD
jgi:hypothetical protein